ncbi:hypothetical protein NLC26_01100 [Candidatus Aminicenantes bacterium AC-708-M15]|jgi:hypothetical protein|nr:hypothetical protein [SCandidatus Aminicenantes bacterium Aminicenantia_JdfR_composite]MCP2597278.1 hypothetical protein [Candidatus Aminicenantes bacterium AC-335-G13]MCP2598404.1 hypothetical protein [Candidatus Aminicenantes bacterium AC-335-L06]MCP2604057.1 hypothetical protein [Candidatus Aminicenantes bacterium AC-708-M15]MCP2605921.1 hypothetical protein [Candidatus Aminicenantes bacterium AC-335-O07]MCP2606426.1 hypothetical protein [Candidatus Aminicenantes bacterium AC-708-I09]MC
MGTGTKIGWLFILALIGYLIFVGIRVAKIYIDDYHLRGVIKKETIIYFGSDSDLINRIVTRANQINIPIKRKEISIIRKEEDYAFFRINYSRILDGLIFEYEINFNYQLKARLY